MLESPDCVNRNQTDETHDRPGLGETLSRWELVAKHLSRGSRHHGLGTGVKGRDWVEREGFWGAGKTLPG